MSALNSITSFFFGSISDVDFLDLPEVGAEVWFTNARYATSAREYVTGYGVIEAAAWDGIETVFTVKFRSGAYNRRVYLTARDLEVA